MSEKITETLNKINDLRYRAEKAEATDNVHRLLSLLETLKVLEKQEVEIESNYSEKCARLQLEVNELAEMVESDDHGESYARVVDRSLANALERLNLAKTDLALRLREITSLKRQCDEVPTQAELVQYERRFSELNAHIQRRLRQTRKYYATYNALMEIKDLMLKETSLLNSMSSQLHDALNSPGRVTLTSSLEGISKSIQQKLQNVQLTLQAEQKACEALKKKLAAANLEKRRCYALLKAFQEECTRNERLRNQTLDIQM
uniref:coiled-coil domain-containing protein 93 isoform X2 n=1 Tax=Erigeron canadensis TaxID=72917 RepID=UPI001CB9AB6B|nr:coiled-coil domain-containing protein 93 isoform X2 [Erigeron canadensis]XP_043612808.1 coiled-coil domain-containing protein 93 isoform X2 [Erigeron canadensis]